MADAPAGEAERKGLFNLFGDPQGVCTERLTRGELAQLRQARCRAATAIRGRKPSGAELLVTELSFQDQHICHEILDCPPV
jgi:hypothetical protein